MWSKANKVQRIARGENCAADALCVKRESVLESVVFAFNFVVEMKR